jgi:hypothetical protein
MIRIDVRGIAEVQSALRNLAAEQLPFAMMVALNNTAFAVQKASRAHLETAFDRPTPLIKGATRVQKATKQELSARTYIDDRRNAVLTVHEQGGPRGDQRVERFLAGRGWLPGGWRAVPTDKMPLNSYGNPKQAEITKIINGLGDAGQANRLYFVILLRSGTRGIRGMSAGIYRYSSRAGLVKLYHFVRRAEYRPELKWLPAMEAEARAVLPGFMSAAVQKALETAR